MSVSVGRIGGSGNPLGKIISLNPNVSDSNLVLEDEDYMPWISFSLFNDGPDPVYVAVNEDEASSEGPISRGEQMSVDMGTRLIDKVILVCDVGEECSIRLKAKS